MDIGQFSLRRILLTMTVIGVVCAVAAPWLRMLSLRQLVIIAIHLLIPAALVGVVALLAVLRKRQLVRKAGKLELRIRWVYHGKLRRFVAALPYLLAFFAIFTLASSAWLAIQTVDSPDMTFQLFFHAMQLFNGSMLFVAFLENSWKPRLGLEFRERGFLYGLLRYYAWAKVTVSKRPYAHGVRLIVNRTQLDINVSPDDLPEVERILDEKLSDGDER